MHRPLAAGIDLGTTNSALATAGLAGDGATVKPAIQAIDQLVSPGEVRPSNMLPSAIYLAAEGELTAEAIRLPWQSDPLTIVGEAARRLGPKIPGRFVTSAKSWLCHDRVDRTAEILPWGAPADARKLSPVKASTLVLDHLRQCWDHAHPGVPLSSLPLILTVPASFDESARRLTVEAARAAGIGDRLTLLEEPQAAFYAWIADHPAEWQSQLRAGETILVCDVGGGTTDFSLIAATEDENGPGFERVAVGDHLMLGGDNMDLALAHMAEAAMGQRLSVDQWTSLRAQARAAKERLLADDPPDSLPIAITGKGSRVVGGSMSTKITGKQVIDTILEGFFPVCGLGTRPAESSRSGFQEFGLPFETDAAVTRHLAGFLGHLPPDSLPSAILFNGGALKPAVVRERIVTILRTWLGEAGRNPAVLRVLENPDLDLAVARGAAYYGAIRHGAAGVRLKSGLARSLYVGMAGETVTPWLCVVERDAQEGEPYAIAGPELSLLAGRKVAFPLATSSIRPQDKPGERIAADARGLRQLPALEAEIKVGRKAKATEVPVRLEARVNPIGTVDLWCVSQADPRRWLLEIGFKAAEAKQADGDSATIAERHMPESSGIVDEATLQLASEKIHEAFAMPATDTSTGPARLVKTLEEALDCRRTDWPASVCRHVFDTLREQADVRKKSAEHESRWTNLAGFSLRPGTGQGGDEARMKFLWSLFGTGPVHAKEAHVWTEWWVMWRRVAPGMNRSWQEELWKRLQPAILGGGKKPDRKLSQQEINEMTRLAASLERLTPAVKLAIGESLVKKIGRDAAALPVALWSLGRLGARQPLYGPLSSVIPAVSVEPWVRRVLEIAPENERTKDLLKWCLLMTARKDNDRSFDLDATLRQQAFDRLSALGFPADDTRAILEYEPIGAALSSQALGETLPVGLTLRAEN
ncbi:Hsp70 family protein [bacterium]|nr:Hsp70 family protein [bacterium]